MSRIFCVDVVEERCKILFALDFPDESEGINKFFFREMTFFALIGEQLINSVFSGLDRRGLTAWKFLSLGNSWQNYCSVKVLFSNALILQDMV